MTTATLIRTKEIFLPIYTLEVYKERTRTITHHTPIDSQLFRVEKVEVGSFPNGRKKWANRFINDDHIEFSSNDILETINSFIRDGKLVVNGRGFGQIKDTGFYFDLMESHHFLKKYKTLK
ncbi:MAG: hypothetical protein ABS904_00290 [Solibacillus isronensis]